MKKNKKSNGKQKEKNRKKTKQPPITKMKEMKEVLKWHSWWWVLSWPWS